MNIKLSNCLLLWALAILAFGSQAHAQFLPGGGVDNPNPTLPPEGVYLSPSDVHAMYSGADLAIVLQAVQHKPFEDQPPRYDPPGAPVQNEVHDFDSDLQAIVTCLDNDPGACAARGLPPGVPLEVLLEGRVQTVAFGKGPTDTTGTFQTEMIAMSLQGFGGQVQVRESPTLPSFGQTRIADNGNGTFHIDSFFDVFTELSLDSGATWIPNDGLPTRVDLVVPEPASIALIMLGLCGGIGLCRRRKRWQ